MQLTLTPDLRPPEPRRAPMRVTQFSATTEAVEVVGLPRGVLVYEGLRSTGGFAVLTGLLELARTQWASESWSTPLRILIGVAAAVLVIDLAILNPRLVRWTRISASRNQFLLITGRLLVTEVAVRVPAILTVDLRQGPLMRMLRLKRVVIRGIGALPEIPPLSSDVADSLQSLLTRIAEPQGLR